MSVRSTADARRRVAADISWRAAMLRMDFQPAIAGVHDAYFQAGFDLAHLLGKLSGCGEDPGAARDLVDACGCRRLYIGLL